MSPFLPFSVFAHRTGQPVDACATLGQAQLAAELLSARGQAHYVRVLATPWVAAAVGLDAPLSHEPSGPRATPIREQDTDSTKTVAA
jgi:hypothetical protein